MDRKGEKRDRVSKRMGERAELESLGGREEVRVSRQTRWFQLDIGFHGMLIEKPK